jgi:hypothetical protein
MNLMDQKVHLSNNPSLHEEYSHVRAATQARREIFPKDFVAASYTVYRSGCNAVHRNVILNERDEIQDMLKNKSLAVKAQHSIVTLPSNAERLQHKSHLWCSPK